MNLHATRLLAFCAGVLLLPTISTFGGRSWESPSGGATRRATALPAEIPTPIDVSGDGELVLLFLPGGQGFELANTRTGQRATVSATPNTGYYASISPGKRYVCFKEFQLVNGARLQVPSLYDIAAKKVVPLDQPAPAAGNPVVSSRGKVAYTLGRRLIVLNADLSQLMETDLDFAANILSFSPAGKRLVFSDPDERIYWLDADTGSRGAAPADSLRGYRAQFSPDGQSLLARSSNGEIRGWHCATGRSWYFGRAQAATWLDNDSVALVCKDAAGFAVGTTRVQQRKLSGESSSTLLTCEGDAGIALNASVLALAAADGISLVQTHTGLSQSVALLQRSAPSSSGTVAQPTPAATPSPNVVTNGSIVQLVGVPYVHQIYDTPDDFNGYNDCCGATSALMAILWYNRLPPHAIICTRSQSHFSNYGFYVPNIYSYRGIVFDIPSTAVLSSGLVGWYGGFGFFLQDTKDDPVLRGTRLSEWIASHDLSSGVDGDIAGATGFNKARAEIDANCPVVVVAHLNNWVYGHHVTCIGYVRNQYTLIFNDPYGNKNVSYPSPDGAGAYYDWPGYNNGYQNLTTVDRYVYARGAIAANTNWGSYWDLNGTAPGAGGAAPGGTWDSTNWSGSAAGTVATGLWAQQTAVFSAGSDATGAYNVSITGTQVLSGLFVEAGTVTFTDGRLYFLGPDNYFSNYVAAEATAIFNTPFVGHGSPDKWGPGTAVYNGASTSTAYFTLNEGTLALGNDAALGTPWLVVGDPNGINVVTLKSADARAHTLPNKLSLSANEFHIGAGGDLTFVGAVDAGPGASVINVSNTFTTFSGVVTNTGGITKTGPGTLVLAGSSANTYGSSTPYGYTTVNGGTLKLSKTAGATAVGRGSLIVNSGGTLLLGAATQIANTVPVILGGGTFQTAGFREQAGTLTVTDDSVIDLGLGASVLSFAASSDVTWTAGTVLTITNWGGAISGGGAAQVVFRSSSSGLTTAQVNQIRFGNPAGFIAGIYSATILSTGEVVPFNVTPICRSPCTSNGQFQFSVAGAPGYSYAILVSADLSNWTGLQTNHCPFTFTDTNSRTFPRRFYRAQYLP